MAAAPAVESDQTTPSAKPSAVPETVAAAIGAALYLRDSATRIDTSVAPASEPGAAWSLSGRQRIMQERLVVFQQAGRNRN